jgi:tape measure domain-containing protein
MVVDEIKIVVKPEADAAIGKMQQLNNAMTSNSKTGLDLAKSIAGYTSAYGLAVQAGQKIIATLGELISNSVKLAAAQERVRMEFGVLTGSMEIGNRIFSDMNRLAAQTPLEMDAITAAGKQLLSVRVPVEQVTDTLRMLGDVAMGNPEKLERLTMAFGQLKSKGVASMEQLNRFIEAGVPIMAELEKQTGLTGQEVFKLVSDGKIGFDDVNLALQNLTSEGGLYHDMMKQVAETTEGKFSTALDNAKMQLSEIGKSMLPAVTEALDWFNQVMDEFATSRNLNNLLSGGTGDIDLAIKKQKELIAVQVVALQIEQNGIFKQQMQDKLTAMNQELAALEAKKYWTDKAAADAAAAKKASDEAAAKAEAEAAALAELQAEQAAITAAMTDMIAAEIGWNNAVVFGTQLTEGMIPGLTDFARLGAGAAVVMTGIYEDAKMMPEAYRKAIDAAADFRIEMDALGASAGVGMLGELFQGGVGTGMSTGLTAFATGALTAEEVVKDLTKEVVKLTEAQIGLENAAISGYKSMAGALGAALVSGEDGWKAFGKSALNAIAGVVDAMAIESDAVIAGAIAQILLGNVTKTPGLGAAIAASIAAHGAAGAIRAIPMANGGEGWVDKPTHFVAGEAGREFVSFTPQNRSGVTVIQNIAGSVIAERNVRSLAVSGVSRAARGW